MEIRIEEGKTESIRKEGTSHRTNPVQAGPGRGPAGVAGDVAAAVGVPVRESLSPFGGKEMNTAVPPDPSSRVVCGEGIDFSAPARLV